VFGPPTSDSAFAHAATASATDRDESGGLGEADALRSFTLEG
jgi:hypothetical protein